MELGLPLLGIGNHSFEQIRNDNLVYVDKTAFIPELYRIGKVVFLSRPRRFGKSLTVSTIDAYYSKETELFKELAAEDIVKSDSFVKRPVIHLDMSEADLCMNLRALSERIRIQLKASGDRYGVKTRGTDSPAVFSNLIQDVYSKFETRNKSRNKYNIYNPEIVLLIDEYDAPVTTLLQNDNYFQDSKLIYEVRNVMRLFYAKVKTLDSLLKFTFITGVTKYSKTGILSYILKNLTDISTDKKFSSITGFTHTEMINNFSQYFNKLENTFGVKTTELLDNFRNLYDGFSFDGETRLYNPYSVVSFLECGEFDHFWMKSGSKSYIKKYFKDRQLTPEQFEGLTVTENFIRMPGEIDKASPEGLLYQSGYLTLRDKREDSFTLDFPNLEVRSDISALFMDNLYSSPEETGTNIEELKYFLENADVPGLVNNFKCMFANISCDDHVGSNHAKLVNKFKDMLNQTLNNNANGQAPSTVIENFNVILRNKLGNGFYRSVLKNYLSSAGAYTFAEPHFNLSRLEIIAKFKGICYIIKIKVANNAVEAKRAARVAMREIHEKPYLKSFDNPILIALAVNRSKRNIGGCIYEKDANEIELVCLK